MADALELTDDDFRIAPDAPPGFWSQQGRTHLFTILFISAMILGFIQLIVPQILVPQLMPQSAPTLMSFKIQSVQASQAVWWQDRLWVTVTTVVPGSPQQISLRAINDEGKWDHSSDLIIPVPYDKLIADGDRLYLLSNTSVTTVESRAVRTTYPRLKLNEPTAPLIVDGKLSILDRVAGQPDISWYDYLDGEWIERGRLELPAAFVEAVAARKTSTVTPSRTVRIRISGGVATPVFSGQQDDSVSAIPLPDGRVRVTIVDFKYTTLQRSATVWSAMDPGLTSSTIAASKDAPADALQLSDPTAAWTTQATELGDPAEALRWDNRDAFVVLEHENSSMSGFGQSLQLFVEENGHFVKKHRLAAFPAESPAPVVKPEGTYLFLGVSPIAPMSISTVELTKDGFGPVKRVGEGSFLDTSRPHFFWIYGLMVLIPTSTTILLGTIAHFAVERYRDRRYSFGHHTVRLASIGRRGTARAIDAFLFGLPMWIISGVFWVSGADLMAAVEQKFNSGDFVTLILWGFGFVLGMLLYVILMAIVFGLMEGLWGLSPGKWLFKVRVIRTTFARIGFFRGMIRQFLLVIDGQFGYFVAILMAACLAKSQRLGDMCADSIVVEQSSLPPNWPNHRHTLPPV